MSHSNKSTDPTATSMVRGLAWDVGLPLIGFYGAHAAGAHDLVALLIASSLAAARVVWVAVRERTLNVFAGVMLVVFGIGLVLAFVSGDPTFLLLKNSFVTGVLALAFLGTAMFGTPLTLAAAQGFESAKKDELRREYDTDPHVRHGHRVSSAVWGIGLLLEALVRVPLVLFLPTTVSVGLSEVLMIVVIGGLIAWNVWYVRWATARGVRSSEPS